MVLTYFSKNIPWKQWKQQKNETNAVFTEIKLSMNRPIGGSVCGKVSCARLRPKQDHPLKGANYICLIYVRHLLVREKLAI